MKALLMTTALLAFAAGALAQSPSAGIAAAQDRNVQHRRTFQVKREHAADFEAALKDLNALYKKAKVDSPAIVLHSLSGPDHYVVVRYYEKMSDAMSFHGDAFKEHATEYQALNIRLARFYESRDTAIATRDSAISLPRTEIPPYISTARTVVKPGMAEEYRSLIKEWVNDGLKPAGVKSYIVSQTRYGGPSTEFRSGTGVTNLAELNDSRVMQAMGAAKFKQWLAKRDALIESHEINIYRYRPELSTWPSMK